METKAVGFPEIACTRASNSPTSNVSLQIDVQRRGKMLMFLYQQRKERSKAVSLFC